MALVWNFVQNVSRLNVSDCVAKRRFAHQRSKFEALKLQLQLPCALAALCAYATAAGEVLL